MGCLEIGTAAYLVVVSLEMRCLEMIWLGSFALVAA
jgi:hypothetical protein